MGMTRGLGWSGIVLAGWLVQEGNCAAGGRWMSSGWRARGGWSTPRGCQSVEPEPEMALGLRSRPRQELWAQHSPGLLLGRSCPVALGPAR